MTKPSLEELALEYQRIHPPYMNHQEAGEDLLALLEQVRAEAIKCHDFDAEWMDYGDGDDLARLGHD